MSRIARHFNPAFVVAAAILILALPHIAANEYELRLITLLLIYAIIALGLNVLVGLTGLVSLGQAGLYAIGAYTAAIFATRLGVGLVPGLILGMALAGAFGVLLAYPTVRVRGVYLAVVTIAFGIIVENVAIEWDSLTGSWVGISNVPAPTLLGLPLDTNAYFIVVGASALIAFLVNLNLMNSRFGRAMRATAQSEIASRSLGINVVAIRTLAFVVSAMAAGAAGVFYVYLNKYISPDIFSFTDSIRFLLMVILGGSGTALGPVVGASIMTYLPEYLQAFGPWQAFAYGLLLAAVMFVLPRGIVGSVEHFLSGRMAEARPDTVRGERPRLADIVAIAPTDGSACLDARGVSVAFGGLVAVDKVDETVDSGKIHALIGPNGAGKSTFLNAISGVYRADSGSITFLGRDTTQLNSHQLARLGLARTFPEHRAVLEHDRAGERAGRLPQGIPVQHFLDDLPAAVLRAGRAAFPAGGDGPARLCRPFRLRPRESREPGVRPPAAARNRPRARALAQAAAAGRAGGRPDPCGDRAAYRTGPRTGGERHNHPDRRAPCRADHGNFRSCDGARLRRTDRLRHCRGGADRSQGDRGLFRQPELRRRAGARNWASGPETADGEA